jgi:hypothetical protein
MMGKTLLEQAQALQAPRRGRSPNWLNDPEVYELAVAWINGEVTDTQCATVMEQTPSNVVAILARALRIAAKEGKIRVVEKR